ncbi:MAG TPA: methyltransferase domain-containing protein [Pyrinomonadaceae bacterium]|nr:methyltransferase domain-containing protein [Pyrinomonadaceae bacterium]
MKKSLLQYLACPSCGGEIHLTAGSEAHDGEILDGVLSCTNCKQQFHVIRGVPRFVKLEQLDEEMAATASSFGWQWQHFTQEDAQYGKQLLGWLQPVTPDFFKDKIVLEGGCGKGRHTQLAGHWGARDVIGVDLSDAVDSAFTATRGSENMHVVQADLSRLPLKPLFDYAFSVGVVHHLEDPEAGFRSLASRIKPGGHLSVWVYGAENNRWITRLIDPLRTRFTSGMSRRGLLHLSKIPTALMYAATKLVYGPLNRSRRGAEIAGHLFYNDYLKSISQFGWREQHTIVFDHLVAPTAHYISREEFEQWWKGIDARDVMITWHNKNSWCGFGRLP